VCRASQGHFHACRSDNTLSSERAGDDGPALQRRHSSGNCRLGNSELGLRGDHQVLRDAAHAPCDSSMWSDTAGGPGLSKNQIGERCNSWGGRRGQPVCDVLAAGIKQFRVGFLKKRELQRLKARDITIQKRRPKGLLHPTPAPPMAVTLPCTSCRHKWSYSAGIKISNRWENASRITPESTFPLVFARRSGKRSL
jgi:hypothetical protein